MLRIVLSKEREVSERELKLPEGPHGGVEVLGVKEPLQYGIRNMNFIQRHAVKCPVTDSSYTVREKNTFHAFRCPKHQFAP